MARNSPQDKKNRDFFSAKFNDLLYKHGKKQIDIANDLNIPKSTLTGYVKGTSLPTPGNIQKIADYFNVKKSDLDLRFSNQNKSDTTVLINVYEQLEPPRQDKVFIYAKEQLKEQKLLQDEPTLYEVKVTEKLAAGLGYSYQENNEVFSVYTDNDNLPNYDIASYITGDSMEPKYHDGDVALIQLGYDNIHGGIYAVDYDGKTFLKKVYFEGGYIRLVSLNKKYDDMVIDLPVEQGTYLNIVGKVVGSFTPVEV